MTEALKIAWCSDARRARELAEFFARNIDPEYISHSELQGPRALSVGKWRPNIVQIFTDEIGPRLAATKDGLSRATSQPILVAEVAGKLVALAFVTFAGAVPTPFAIIEDLVVTGERRSLGIGKAVMDWIAAEALARDIGRLFLESGIANERAHHFFEREGFSTVSVVMMRSLNADHPD
jgi:GNAT superfamily N-acetyltransferase